jgi:predicted DNA-binding transcriptional regulator AlpA
MASHHRLAQPGAQPPSTPPGIDHQPSTTQEPLTAMTTTRDSYLTIPEVIAEIRVKRATFYRWRQLGKGPRSIKLPNGGVRIRRSELDRWLASLEEDAA